MQKYLFLLGSTPDLSFAELQAIFGSQVQRFQTQVAVANLATPLTLTPTQLMARLGGTVKVAAILQELPAATTPDAVQNCLVDHFLSLNQTKVHFAIGEIGRDHLEAVDLIALKNRLQENGLKVRFNDGSRHGASAALLLNCQRLTEILLVQGEDTLLVANTLAVQDIDDWTLRDRSKPYADHKKGMLPPKLARMMVNLAIGPRALDTVFPTHPALYDPFCGSGTVLMEGAFSQLALFGSDLDVRAVLGAKENLAWLAQTYQMTPAATLFTADATHVERAQLQQTPIDFLVTEPFLGKQTPKSSELVNVFRGLEKMYWGAFRHWVNLLAPHAKLVIIFPRVKADSGQIFTLDSLLDKLATLGYNKQSSGLFYARPQAIVEREIAIFTYEPKSER